MSLDKEQTEVAVGLAKELAETGNSRYTSAAPVMVAKALLALHEQVKELQQGLEWAKTFIADERNRVRELEKENANLKEVLAKFKTGSCFCDVGIGDPRMSGHTRACEETREILK